MIDFIISFILTICALLIGFNLGKHNTPLPESYQDRIKRIMRRKLRLSRDTGAVERPSAEQNYYRDHPERRREIDMMENIFGDGSDGER